MKARDSQTETLKDVYVKALDSLPVGSEIDFDGDISDIPAGWEETTDVNSYSTSEIKTNKTWINGKPIYRKVIYISSLPNATATTYQHNISNAELVWCDLGNSFINIALINATAPIQYVHPDFIATNGSPALNVAIYDITTSNFKIKTAQNRTSWSAYVTLLYTKTTD